MSLNLIENGFLHHCFRRTLSKQTKVEHVSINFSIFGFFRKFSIQDGQKVAWQQQSAQPFTRLRVVETCTAAGCVCEGKYAWVGRKTSVTLTQVRTARCFTTVCSDCPRTLAWPDHRQLCWIDEDLLTALSNTLISQKPWFEYVYRCAVSWCVCGALGRHQTCDGNFLNRIYND